VVGIGAAGSMMTPGGAATPTPAPAHAQHSPDPDSIAYKQGYDDGLNHRLSRGAGAHHFAASRCPPRRTIFAP
jgi:hypothetical protein